MTERQVHLEAVRQRWKRYRISSVPGGFCFYIVAQGPFCELPVTCAGLTLAEAFKKVCKRIKNDRNEYNSYMSEIRRLNICDGDHPRGNWFYPTYDAGAN